MSCKLTWLAMEIFHSSKKICQIYCKTVPCSIARLVLQPFWKAVSHIVELKWHPEMGWTAEWNKLEASLQTWEWWFLGGGAGDMARNSCKWNDLYISGKKEWENLGVFILRTRSLVFLFSIFGVNYLEQSPSGFPIFWCVPICSGILPFVNLAPTTNHRLYCYQSTKPPSFAFWETTQASLVWYVSI